MPRNSFKIYVFCNIVLWFQIYIKTLTIAQLLSTPSKGERGGSGYNISAPITGKTWFLDTCELLIFFTVLNVFEDKIHKQQDTYRLI